MRPFCSYSRPRERSRHGFEEVIDVPQEKVVCIAEVAVKRGASNADAVENFLDADLIEGLLEQDLHQRITEAIAGRAHPRITAAVGNHHLSGQRRLLCSVSLRTHDGQLRKTARTLMSMTDNRAGGIALIIGAMSGVVTMILHPVSGGSGGHVMTHAQFETLAALIKGVHALAIAGIPFLFLGALALSRQLEMGGRLALLALVIYSLGLVAVMIAPAISGLVGTQILRKTVQSFRGERPMATAHGV